MDSTSRSRAAWGGATAPPRLQLTDGSRIAVVGGGPAGSLFSDFALQAASRAGLDIAIDLYEPRDFTNLAPHGCNMCGGIISESLVQNLAAEGIALPPTVVQRGLTSYQLHMDAGSVRIEAPRDEKRIGVVHRGAGPRDLKDRKWASFDHHLLGLAVERGACVKHERVREVRFRDGYPELSTGGDAFERYDLLVMAVGVNSPMLRQLEQLDLDYHPPETAKAFIREFYLGQDEITRTVGDSMHVFLLDIPRLEVAAIIPKGDYISVCLLGENVDKALVERFFATPEVRACLPDTWAPEVSSCECWPKISLSAASRTYADRLVLVGDCGVTRLYKDGIGAAYRTAKAAATTAVIEGISAECFEQHYAPACRAIDSDNAIGRFMFWVTHLIQRHAFARRAVLGMTAAEQRRTLRPRMSVVLWDLFTGSAPYREALWHTMHPVFVARLLGNVLLSVRRKRREPVAARSEDGSGALGHVYQDGEVIIRQGDEGECMYVILEGQVRVLVGQDGRQVEVATLGPGELVGEMAIFDKEVRSATVVAMGETRALTLDRANFMRRIHDDPMLAWRVVTAMSKRIRRLDEDVARLRAGGGAGTTEMADAHQASSPADRA
ncbi:MAG: cyclic nucleotide-binding domain-containing protein [Planctomycetota bacterium]|jgi:flavin-dependent dehydrogenase